MLYANHFFSECYIHCLGTIGMKNLKTKQKYEQKCWRKNQVQKKWKKQCESQVFFEPNRQRCVIFFLCDSLFFFVFAHDSCEFLCVFIYSSELFFVAVCSSSFVLFTFFYPPVEKECGKKWRSGIFLFAE